MVGERKNILTFHAVTSLCILFANHHIDTDRDHYKSCAIVLAEETTLSIADLISTGGWDTLLDFNLDMFFLEFSQTICFGVFNKIVGVFQGIFCSCPCFDVSDEAAKVNKSRGSISLTP